MLVNECSSAHNHEDPLELDTETYPESGAYDDVNMHLGWAVAQFYVENYTNPEDKERISELVDEIIAAYHGIIGEADFISDMTRAGAYAKLDHLSKNVLYPDSWGPYNFEDVDFAAKEEGGTLWEAYRAIQKHEHKKEVSKAAGPYDKTAWDGFPFGVSCSYEPDVNGIYIYACLDTLEMAKMRLIDVHPMNDLRVNGVLQQYDEFLNFYGITEGDNMYLAPEDRVAIW